MERIILREQTHIAPFAEPARELRLLNKPLWLLQRDLLKSYCKGGTEVDDLSELPRSADELLVHRDNLFFNAALIDSFIQAARASKRACRIAFRASTDTVRGDASIERHALQLCAGIVRHDDVTYLEDGVERQGAIYLADLYYFPNGPEAQPMPLLIDTLSHEMGYYHIPSYMANKGDLTYQIPQRAFLSIESWLHVFMANILMGVFSYAAEQDVRMSRARLRNIMRWDKEDWRVFPGKLAFSLGAIWEKLNPFEEMWRNHFLASRSLVKIGKNCSIDPSAVIHGPTTIGDNVYIGTGVVIANSIIGNNVNVMQGSQVMLSVVSDRCFIPFNGALFMTTLMENSMVAQNSTLQLTVVGRNTFIGANNCFTDFNLQGEQIKLMHQGQLTGVNLPVLGSAVGHNVKIGSGFVVYPGRMIESNAVIIFDNDMNLIRATVPGHDPNDVDVTTGEPRRIIYHWPNVYHDPVASRDSTPSAPPAPPLSEPGSTDAASSWRQPTETPPQEVGRNHHERPVVGVAASARRRDR
ncbi:MAG: multidrug transporter [Candidatus Viridilinea halotolerans]|uniref:Multidrug transporter n=1 Tax=Candidatus Viridilinea halotolerans TaxID=2491704 RepID=A0A426TWF1_9CHLR|nr:MAG: multidrug transporter [Candidatus Viridilinea halotolerans]